MVRKSLFELISRDKIISVLMILCIFFSSLVINFAYGLYQNYHVMKNEQIEETYVMSFSIESEITKGQLTEFAISLSEGASNTVDYWEVFLKHDDDEYFCPFSVKNGRLSLSDDVVKSLISFGWIKDGSFYNKMQLESAELVAVAPANSLNSENDIGNKLEVLDREYKIIGHHKLNSSPSIPYTTVNDTVSVSRITLVLNRRLTKSIYDEMIDKSNSVFGEKVRLPRLKLPDESDKYLYNTVMLISFSISFIAAMNFVILYRFIFIKRKRNIAIFRMCGCTRIRAILMYMLECMLIIMPIYIISALIYHYSVMPLFKDIYIYMRGAYSIWVYLVIFGIYLISSIILLFVMMLKEISKAPLGALRGGDNR